MSKNFVRGMLAVVGAASAASSVMAQAPASAQVWDVRFVVDNSGPFSQGINATQVGITMYARVGILANASASGTRNFGPSRIGGNAFRITFTDALSAGGGLNQGSVAQGGTADIDGRNLTDTNGNALAGHFAPFRGSFAPQVAPLFLGANSEPVNGSANNPATGSPFLTNVVGSRALNYGSDGTLAAGNAVAVDSNAANLVGDLVPVYRLYYFPRADFTLNAIRDVTVNVTNLSARYLHSLSGAFGTAAAAINLPNQSFSFRVPTPGAAALVGLGGLVAARRRRA